jgi:pimeloyl-ACP methyl ester carboxylesterase
MSHPAFLHRPRPRTALIGGVAVLAVLATSVGWAGATSGSRGPKPTIVLVHGAFADASGWAPTVEKLQKKGYDVLAPANPLRGVAADSAYIRTLLAQIPGPIVLVGHSYGGFVNTNAATGNPNVKALVYIAAFAPDEGESIQSISAAHPGSKLGPDTLEVRAYPLPDGTDGHEGYIKLDAFRDVFAADLPRRTAAINAVSQRPADLAALGAPSGAPAWKTIPSWYLVATQDNAIGVDAERFMAARAGAHTVEVKASHSVFASQPDAVTDLILDAARATD